MCSHLYASPVINYETFSQLPRSEQIKVVKMLQEYVTHLEHTQLKSQLKKSPRYTQILKLFSLISEAHADPDTTAEPAKPQEQDENDGLLDINKNGQACVYAGWISYKTSGCRHPYLAKTYHEKQVSDPSLKEFISEQQYPTEGQFISVTHKKVNGKTELNFKESISCKAPGKIACSPTLFGQVDGKMFCVDGNDRNYNSSYLCSQAVAKHSESKKILNSVIQKVLDNENTRKEFNYLLMSMYDTCMCKGSTGFMNKDYSEKMFPSRTCFAWMYQSQRIMSKIVQPNSKCRSPFEKYNYGNLATMADWMDRAAKTLDEQIKPITSSENAQEFFDITTRVDTRFKETREDAYRGYQEKRLCPLQLEPTVAIKIKDTADPLWVKLTAKLVGVVKDAGQVKGWKFALAEDEKGEIKDDGNAENNIFLAKKSAEEYKVKATVENITGEVTIPKLKTPVISIKQKSATKDTVSLEAEVVMPDERKYTIEWSNADVTKTNTIATAKRKTESYKVHATLKVGEKSIESNKIDISPFGYKIEIAIVPDRSSGAGSSEKSADATPQKTVKIKATVTKPEGQESSITWSGGATAVEGNTKEATAEKKTESYKVQATLKVGEKEFKSNELEIPALENNYSIKIEQTAQDGEKASYKAIVQNNGKEVTDLSGLDIKWYKYKKKETTSPSTKSRTTSNSGLNTEIQSEDKDEDGETTKGPDRHLKAGSGKETDVKKYSFEQMVYAKIADKKSNELKVDKKPEAEEEETKESQPVNYGNPVQQQMRQAPPRPRSLRINMGVR